MVYSYLVKVGKFYCFLNDPYKKIFTFCIVHFEFLFGNSGYTLTGKKNNYEPFQSKYITLTGYESYDLLGKKGICSESDLRINISKWIGINNREVMIKQGKHINQHRLMEQSINKTMQNILEWKPKGTAS